MTGRSGRELVPPAPDQVLFAQPLTRRYLTELPQGRKAARVGWLWRVRGGPLRSRGRGTVAGTG